MTQAAEYQERIAYLEGQVQQLRERVVVLETQNQFMATKEEVIASQRAPLLSFGGRKRKSSGPSYWINNNRNFALALAVMSLAVFLTVMLYLHFLKALLV